MKFLFFYLVRYNRLRDKFPAASFSGRPILSEAGFDLLNNLLTYDPEKVMCYCYFFFHDLYHAFIFIYFNLSTPVLALQRLSADAALQHEWFREVPLPKSKDFMPTFPALNELDRYFFATI